MRVTQPLQPQLGELAIADIDIDLKSRDEIAQLLRGLQYIYTHDDLRGKVFQLLEDHIQPKINKETGRPGLSLWNIFVMGVFRLDLNWDYDHLHGQVNNHKTLRQMLGHADIFDSHYYHCQTIKDNVTLLTPKLLDEINQVVVQAGHGVAKKKENAGLRGRCDSFVVESNVHYPTDINLLYDAMRKVITLIARLCESHDMTDWRQQAYNVKQVKRAMWATQMKKRGGGKTEAQKIKRQAQIIEAHRAYIDVAQPFLDKARLSLKALEDEGLSSVSLEARRIEIKDYIAHADRQIDQIKRRVLQGETIPHDEKVFSIFEPHREWIVKGKAGVPVELGLRVCVLEDQHQFLLHYRVMEKETDDRIAVDMVSEAKKRFADLTTCSFDKGFHSPSNQKALAELLTTAALPRKGKLSEKAKTQEASDEFRRAHKNHSAIESAINALEVHGLDCCPDKGIDGFKRYVALAIVARNLQRLGTILIGQERQRLERQQKRRLKQAA
jgi:IS5 family transposase